MWIGRDAIFNLDKSSKIYLSGICKIGFGDVIGARRLCIVLYEEAQLNIEPGVEILSGAEIQVLKGASLHIGRNTSINRGNILISRKSIRIGDECSFAPGVTVRDSMGHKPNGIENCKPISIGDHVWLATGVIILSGVSIGFESIIGAYSLVNKDVRARCMAVGIPARIIKEGVFWN